MIRGKTSEEALAMSGEELAGGLGPLPPMKIHCGQLVEGALRSALDPANEATRPPKAASAQSPNLLESLSAPEQKKSGVRIVFLDSSSTG